MTRNSLRKSRLQLNEILIDITRLIQVIEHKLLDMGKWHINLWIDVKDAESELVVDWRVTMESPAVSQDMWEVVWEFLQGRFGEKYFIVDLENGFVIGPRLKS